jgi:prepilin-type N-terminal cleavage/methylation domain-containing protein
MTSNTNTSAGFTLLEVMTVCAIVGVLALIAYPNMVRFNERHVTKASATRIAGMLDTARSLAISEATPQLVYINPKTVDGDGNCGAAAVLVRDSDRSYSISDGDGVRQITLDPSACRVTQPFGESGSSADASIALPSEDLAVRGLEMKAEMASEESEDAEESAALQSQKVADVVVNGATFPIDADSGRPVVAFSERGIPVDPENPASWGSGAGAVYLTDGHSTVYAVVVQPLGNVQLRVYDHVSGAWR